jgi:hypothetical protein
MLPSSWPNWILIPISLGLTALTVIVGLFLEPAVQAITPVMEPTPEVASFPARLPYAAPVSGGCVECHLSESALRDAGADDANLQIMLLPEDSPMTLHGRLGCVTCHDGIGTTQNIEAAHENLVADPSHAENAHTYCLPCHQELPAEYPEHSLQAPHDTILVGIEEGTDVCSCSNCHGSVAHGVDPLTSHDTLAAAMDTCVVCHDEQSVPEEALMCSGCHVGPHTERTDCETCHASTEIWSKIELASHPMALEGAHATLECYECHIKPDFSNLGGYECSDCHTKPHEFGGEGCLDCHIDGGEWDAIDEAGIDHLAIWEDYQYHEDVACEGCHFAGYELSTECSSCHVPEDES